MSNNNKMNSINTHTGVFLIAFIADQHHYIFTSFMGTMGDLIKTHNQYGIDKIMRYNKAKCKFEKLSKAEIRMLFDWDTHSIIELEKTNFLK